MIPIHPSCRGPLPVPVPGRHTLPGGGLVHSLAGRRSGQPKLSAWTFMSKYRSSPSTSAPIPSSLRLTPWLHSGVCTVWHRPPIMMSSQCCLASHPRHQVFQFFNQSCGSTSSPGPSSAGSSSSPSASPRSGSSSTLCAGSRSRCGSASFGAPSMPSADRRRAAQASPTPRRRRTSTWPRRARRWSLRPPETPKRRPTSLSRQRHLLASMFLRKSRRKSKSLSQSRRTGANASSAARPCGKHANSSTPKRASSGLLGQA
mmetsp:Transcript_33408/g.82035  ORF Transcript_33408/g.82035 Transcript_33408/m.82035 type:complete len:259 (-) Transcript_33408:158-934(-)